MNVTESLPLARFIYERSWTPVLGAYIYPLKFFSNERSLDPNDYLEVIRVVNVTGTDVAITRGGGLYVRPRPERSKDATVILLNLLLCEMALNGLVSQPITDTDIQSAKLIGRHASITGGYGPYGERTWGPYSLLASAPRDMGAQYGANPNDYWPINFYWTVHDMRVLDKIDHVPNATILSTVGSSLPALIVAAVSHADRHNIAETILTAWIACETVLSHEWLKYIDELSDSQRARRLKDFRIYTASVQTEVLLTANRLDVNRYSLLQRARKIRNDLAHGAKMSQDGAATTMEAMRSMIESTGMSTVTLPGFAFMSGGIGEPQESLNPAFPFR